MKRCLRCANAFESATHACPACGFAPKERDGFISFAPALAERNAGFKPSEFAALASVENTNWWFKNRNYLIGQMVSGFFPNARSVLDIGCGTGYVLSFLQTLLPGAALNGSEIYTEGLRYARHRFSKANLFQADARALPYDSEFDLVVALDVIEHIQEDAAVLREMHRSLRPGGGVIVTVPQHRFLWSLNDDHACHVRRYERRELRDKLRAAGFVVERMTSFVSLLLPLAFASRLRRRDPVSFDPMSEYKIPHWMNEAFFFVSTMERAAVKAGANFPMGNSLLAVARKPA